MTQLKSRSARLLLACVAVTLLLYLVPYGAYLAYPLLLISTVAHEMGHGVAAMMTGASFVSLEMWANGAGVASYTGGLNRLETAFVAAGGLIGPAVVAALAFVCAPRAASSRVCLMAFGVFLVLAEVLVVKGLFALFFIGLVAAAILWLGLKASDRVAQAGLVFLAVQLALSVFSRSDYLFARTAGSGLSDVAVMASALWLPYWMWGLLCGALSLAVLAAGTAVYLRSVER